MSLVTYASLTSLKVIAVSVDGSQSGNSTVMSRFVEDRQRYDALACGVSTTSKETSPAQDIESMVKKLRVVMREAPVPTPRAGQKQ
ncbi:hypothetical protein EG329_006422 [Mollisiaceae sp. DMI_Dod_QoI]|nr:hypothetical protein EG329_006422 [Helotiales sp. DMI_Dod_QoI]